MVTSSCLPLTVGWEPVPHLFDIALKLVARVDNPILIGLPFILKNQQLTAQDRNAELLHSSVEYTTSVAVAALILGLLSNILRSYYLCVMLLQKCCDTIFP